jgi:hypothetical protein
LESTIPPFICHNKNPLKVFAKLSGDFIFEIRAIPQIEPVRLLEKLRAVIDYINPFGHSL